MTSSRPSCASDLDVLERARAALPVDLERRTSRTHVCARKLLKKAQMRVMYGVMSCRWRGEGAPVEIVEQSVVRSSCCNHVHRARQHLAGHNAVPNH